MSPCGWDGSASLPITVTLPRDLACSSIFPELAIHLPPIVNPGPKVSERVAATLLRLTDAGQPARGPGRG